MQVDNVSSARMPGFADLGISPHSIEEILQEMLRQPWTSARRAEASFRPAPAVRRRQEVKSLNL